MAKNRGMGYEEFFKTAANFIITSSNVKTDYPMKFMGYDGPFMESECIRYAIREFIDNEIDHWENDKQLIEAILTEGDDIGVLRDIHNYLVKDKGAKRGVRIYTVPKKITKGFTIIPGMRVCGWNSEKDTVYPPEKGKGIIYRESLNAKRIEVFDEAFYRHLYNRSTVLSFY
jgi:hypothetical protein